MALSIALDGLGFGYPGRPVGRGVSLELPAGAVACLLGPNGSGKTTLFRTLLGLIPRQAGAIGIAGRELAAYDRRALARAIAYVPQAHADSFAYTAFDMVLMGRTAHHGPFVAPGRADRARAAAALADLGIADLADQPFPTLSGGQRQLVLVARALAQDAPFMVLDEPTASLDYGNQVRVLRHVRRLAAGGLGVVLSTHNPDHALALAARVVMLDDGRVVADGAADAVLTAERLSRVYGVAIEVVTLAGGRRVCVPDYAAG